MKLNPIASAYAMAAMWGGGVLLVGIINLSSRTYGLEFLELLASVYPGYTVSRTIDSVIVATGYAILEGAMGGWLFAWLYNRVLKQ